MTARPPVAVFAGTTEGRLLCERLAAAGVAARAFAATDYGGGLLDGLPGIVVHAGRLDATGMERELAGVRVVVDATHPYAVEAGRNVRAAAERAGARYVRLARSGSALPEDAVVVGSVAEAAGFLAGVEGNALVCTGSKELSAYCAVPDFSERLYVRTLPGLEALRAVLDLGFPPAHVICMQGPHSREMNVATLRFARASWLVTKDSGRAGGMEEKLAAAREAGATAVVVARPVESEEGVGLDEAFDLASRA